MPRYHPLQATLSAEDEAQMEALRKRVAEVLPKLDALAAGSGSFPSNTVRDQAIRDVAGGVGVTLRALFGLD